MIGRVSLVVEVFSVTQRDTPVAFGHYHGNSSRVYGRSERAGVDRRGGLLTDQLDGVKNAKIIATRKVEAIPVAETWIVGRYHL